MELLTSKYEFFLKVPRKRSIDQFGWFHHGLKNLIEGRDDRTDTVLFISPLRSFLKIIMVGESLLKGYNQFVQHPHQMNEFEI